MLQRGDRQNSRQACLEQRVCSVLGGWPEIAGECGYLVECGPKLSGVLPVFTGIWLNPLEDFSDYCGTKLTTCPPPWAFKRLAAEIRIIVGPIGRIGIGPGSVDYTLDCTQAH